MDCPLYITNNTLSLQTIIIYCTLHIAYCTLLSTQYTVHTAQPLVLSHHPPSNVELYCWQLYWITLTGLTTLTLLYWAKLAVRTTRTTNLYWVALTCHTTVIFRFGHFPLSKMDLKENLFTVIPSRHLIAHLKKEANRL